jgi:hypothetical protein
MSKKKIINYYCATWLLLLEFTFNVWKYILIHCLKLKGINHKNIEFRKPNINLAFQNELEAELEGQAPFTMELVRKELEKSVNDNLQKLYEHRREVAERARTAIATDNKYFVGSFKKSDTSKMSAEEKKAATSSINIGQTRERFQDILAEHVDVFGSTLNPDDRLIGAPSMTVSMMQSVLDTLSKLEGEPTVEQIIAAYPPEFSKLIEENIPGRNSSIANEFPDEFLVEPPPSKEDFEKLDAMVEKLRNLQKQGAIVNDSNTNGGTSSTQVVDVDKFEQVPVEKLPNYNELEMFKHSKNLNEEAKQQVKRQVEAVNKRNKQKKDKPKKHNIKKVSKSTKK